MDSFEVLIIILAVISIIVLTFVAVALFYVVMLFRQFKTMSSKALHAVEMAEKAAAGVKNASKAATVAEIVKGVRDGVKKGTSGGRKKS